MASADASYTERRRAFRRLHESGCFVLPNPWDAGSARYLQRLGFKALATTSAGCAWTNGEADGAAGLDATLANIRAIVGATDLPVNADFESGFAATPEGVASNVAACVATGVAGLSIEDSTGRSDSPLHPLPVAVERLRAEYDDRVEIAAHVNPIGYSELRHILEKNGFEIVKLFRDKPKGRTWLYRPIVALIRFIARATPNKKRDERWTEELASDEILLGGNTLIIHAVLH